MKVLIFVKEFAAPTLTFIYNEVLGLSKRVSVKLITCNRINKDLFPFEDVIELEMYRNKYTQKYIEKLQHKDFEIAFKNQSFERSLKEIIQDFNPDIIHGHFGHQSWPLWKNNKNKSIPLFISFHGYDASHKLRSQRYIKTLNTIISETHVHPIFVSHHMQKCVEEKLSRNIKKSRVLYYGTDVEFFKRKNHYSTPSSKVFLQVSSFSEKKGHKYTIKAFQQFLAESDNKEHELILAGDGHLRGLMESYCDELGISKNVKFPGLVNRDQARNLMENADVFVHNSVTSLPVGDKEGIPNAIMEAMAMELPILSTYHSGIPELVTHGKHGLLSKERDIQEYVDNFKEISEWPLAPQNREKIIKSFEKEQHCDSLVEIYNSVL